MTLDEFITAVKAMPKGFLVKLAEVSGYDRSHICRVVNRRLKPGSQTLADLIDSLERAAIKQKEDEKSFSFQGVECEVCGNTLRYIADSKCVTCNRQRVLKNYYKRRGAV